MNRLRAAFSNPRRIFFAAAIIPVLAFNFPANAWMFGLMLPSAAWWLAWGAAAAFESSIVAIQTMLPATGRGTQERRAAWVGLSIVVGLSIIANVGHDVQYFEPASSKLAGWLGSIVPGAEWLLPVLTGVTRPAVLIVFSIVVAGPQRVTVTNAVKVAASARQIVPQDAAPLPTMQPNAASTQPIAATMLQVADGGEYDMQQLAQLTGKPRSTLSSALSRLAASGAVQRSGRGRYLVNAATLAELQQ